MVILYVLFVLTLFISTSSIAYFSAKTKRADFITAFYILYITLSQILATKVASFGPIVAPAAVLLYPFTYQLTDTMNEHFGKKETYRMIFIAFISQILFFIFMEMGIRVETSPFFGYTEWESIFSQTFGITAASWISFLITENLDAFAYAKLKDKYKEKGLWIRSVLSDVPMLAMDSFIFVFLAFGLFDWPINWPFVWDLMLGQLWTKWIFGVVDTPFLYLDRYIWRIVSRTNMD